jgi:hypothetical protein
MNAPQPMTVGRMQIALGRHGAATQPHPRSTVCPVYGTVYGVLWLTHFHFASYDKIIVQGHAQTAGIHRSSSRCTLPADLGATTRWYTLRFSFLGAPLSASTSSLIFSLISESLSLGTSRPSSSYAVARARWSAGPTWLGGRVAIRARVSVRARARARNRARVRNRGSE